MRLLVTRPEPDSERTALALRAGGHTVLCAPMLVVEPLPETELGTGPWTAILLTSANGARAAMAHPRFPELKHLPVLAVGRRSADAARAAGFADVGSADGDSSDLVRLTVARFPSSGRLLYLAGQDRSRDLASDLAAAGIAMDMAVVYRARPATVVPDSVRTAMDGGLIDGVVHFSRRSVDAYLGSFAAEAALAPVHYCLSDRAAGPLRAAGAIRVAVAAQPDEAALLDLVASAGPKNRLG